MIWAFGGGLSLAQRLEMCEELHALTPSSIRLPDRKGDPIMDFEVVVDTQEWSPWTATIEDVSSSSLLRAALALSSCDV